MPVESYKVSIDGHEIGEVYVSSDFDMIAFDLNTNEIPWNVAVVAGELWRCAHGGGEFMPTLEAAKAELEAEDEKGGKE